MKVAILGTAPHFVKAPFGDPSWEIWGTNPITGYGDLPRWDRWFELHSDESIDTYPGHRDWLKAAVNPVYLRKPSPEISFGIEYPLAQMVQRYGTWFFTSSIAYMMAFAIALEGVTDIALFGVDCAHESEYASQKPGVRFFVQVATMAGIRVSMPAEAEVAVPGRLYCYDDGRSILRMKAEQQVEQLRGRAADNQRIRDELVMKRLMLSGALNLNLSREMMQEQLEAIEAGERAAERDHWIYDGAIQQATRVLNNWLPE